MSTAARSLVIGLAAGFAGGLLGVGGGIVIVPGLVLWLHFDQHLAHGTSVAVIVVSALASALVFAEGGQVDWPSAGYLLIGAVAGAYGGARLAGAVSERWLGRAFLLLLLVAAVRLAVVP